MNDNKYVRLYPERAVAPLRTTARRLLDLFAVNDLPVAFVELETELDRSLNDLEDEGFPPDEPLFLLRGQDKLAHDAVRFYADLCAGQDAEIDADDIVEFADRMMAWEPRKLPD